MLCQYYSCWTDFKGELSRLKVLVECGNCSSKFESSWNCESNRLFFLLWQRYIFSRTKNVYVWRELGMPVVRVGMLFLFSGAIKVVVVHAHCQLNRYDYSWATQPPYSLVCTKNISFSTISLYFWSKFTGKLTELKFLLQNFHFSHTFYHTIFRTILLFSSSRYAYHFNEFGVGDNLHPQNIVDRSFKLVIFSANTAGYMHWKTTTRQLIIESI